MTRDRVVSGISAINLARASVGRDKMLRPQERDYLEQRLDDLAGWLAEIRDRAAARAAREADGFISIGRAANGVVDDLRKRRGE